MSAWSFASEHPRMKVLPKRREATWEPVTRVPPLERQWAWFPLAKEVRVVPVHRQQPWEHCPTLFQFPISEQLPQAAPRAPVVREQEVLE